MTDDISRPQSGRSPVSVQYQDFDMAEEYRHLQAGDSSNGAVVTFTGLVRDLGQNSEVRALTLEHYPGMTEKAMLALVKQAKARWPIGDVRLIHRVGTLALTEQIVFVGVTSVHRQAAFEACQYLMDHLKNDVPLWKKEHTGQGDHWVPFNHKDKQALKRWYADKT